MTSGLHHPFVADTLAALFNAHFLQPFASVAQVLVFGAMLVRVLEHGLSRHEEHWGHVILRPAGIGAAGLGIIEICKIAASAALSGSLGF